MLDRLDGNFPMACGTRPTDACEHVHTHVHTRVDTHVYTQVALEALAQDSEALQYVGDDLRADRGFMVKAVLQVTRAHGLASH